MTKAQPIDLSIIDAEDIKKVQEKKKRLDRVMQVIHESGLDQNKEFMDEINVLVQALLEEK
ncbi:MAG: hypothetical protein NTY80_03905 [candidate division SR1 bacterium]|nr:hypothetical protein [candidate division SR1 bacterium]